MILKKNGMRILIENLPGATKAIGSLIKVNLLILLVLTICTCSRPKLMLGNQILGNQTDYFTYSGKLVKPIIGHMECATLK